MNNGPNTNIALRLATFRSIRVVIAGTVGAAMSAAIAYSQTLASGAPPPDFTGGTAFWVAAAVLLGGALTGVDKYLREAGFYGKAG